MTAPSNPIDVKLATLHDHKQLLEVGEDRDVNERISIDQQQIGLFPRLDRAHLIRNAQ